MEITILGKIDNLLLNRTEIIADVQHAGESTPARKDLKKALAAKLSVDAELIAVRKLEPSFGNNSKLWAFAYKSKEDMQKFEPKHILKRGAPKEAAKEGAAPEAKPAAEKEAK